jgi:hypothetical protein
LQAAAAYAVEAYRKAERMLRYILKIDAEGPQILA